MEELFQKLCIHAVGVVGKAAFGMAVTKAIKNIGGYISDTDSLSPCSPDLEMTNLKRLENKLQQKIDVISPLIDMIQDAFAKSNNPGLKAVLKMINDLNETLDSLESNKDIKDVISQVQLALDQLEECVPYINLVMFKVNSNLSTSILLNASKHLDLETKFQCKVYNLFKASIREEPWSWKTEMMKADLYFSRTNFLDTKLNIIESFDDELVHEDEPQTKNFKLQDLESFYYSSSGELLKIPEYKGSVLVLKFKDFLALELVDCKYSLLLLEAIIKFLKIEQNLNKSIFDIPNDLLVLHLNK